MSLHPNMHAFLVAQKKALTLPDELDLPPHDFSVGEGQRYQLIKGDRYHILNAARDGVAHLELSSWSLDPLRGAVATFLNVTGNTHFQVSNQQLAKLEAVGRFRPDGDIPQGAAMTLTAAQMARAEYWLDYVNAVRDKAREDEPDRIDRPSMKLVNEVAAEKAAERGDAKPPHYNTLVKKYHKAECGAYDRAVGVAPNASTGNTIKKIPSLVTKLLEQAAIEAWRMPSGTWRDVKTVFLALLEKPEYAFLRATMFDANGRLAYPSDRHFQRVKAAMPKYMQVYLRFGPERAARVYSVYIKQLRPDLPLDIVDCDFTVLDIVVFDERTMGAYGRPQIIVFRDRCTGSAIGFAVFFDSPSYHSFLAGLRHAMFPKDVSRFPGLVWRQYGLPTAVSFDNELVSDNMTMAAKRLGFQTVEHRPGHPWQKGMMERLFGILNVQTIHNLPGTTMSNTHRRRMFDDSKELGKPVLTLEELEMFLTVFFCEYNATGHVGLGPISTLEGVPNDLWDMGIAKATQRPPIDPFTLVHLAGDCKTCTIQNVGVRWSNLVYASPELFVLRNNPLHVEGKTGVNTTEYLAYRDPNDLSAIWVVDPYTTPNRVIMVPICYEHAKYASGLTLYQHQKYLDEYHKRKRGREPRDIDELLEVQKTFAPALQKMHEERKLHSTATKLARFFSSIGRKFRHSRIVTAPESATASAELIDWEKPFAAKPVASGSSWNATPHATNPKALVRIGNASLDSDDPVETDLTEWRDTAPAEPTPSTTKYDLTEDFEAWARKFDPGQFKDEGE